MKRNWFTGLLLTVWAVVVMFGLAAVSVRHMATLPQPGDESRLRTAMLNLRTSSNRDFLVHVIYKDCSCSRALFAHILARGPFPDSEELVVFVGTDTRKQIAARHAGFEFIAVTESELGSRFGLEAAPVLIAFDPAGTLRYAGGYYANPAEIAPLDQQIHSQLKVDTNVQPLPIFGCAVSIRLQKSLDPLRFLYSKR